MAAKKRRKKAKRKGKRRTAAQRAATKRLVAMNKKRKKGGKKTKRRSKKRAGRRRSSVASHYSSSLRRGRMPASDSVASNMAAASKRGYGYPIAKTKRSKRRSKASKGQAVTLRSLLHKTRGKRSVMYICGGGRARTGCGGGSRGNNRVVGILR